MKTGLFKLEFNVKMLKKNSHKFFHTILLGTHSLEIEHWPQ